MTAIHKNVLAIETAVSGGSLSLLKDGKELANWIGDSDVSRAEDLLVKVDRLLKNTGLDKQNLDLIAVSAGPGSFTGIRIGIATALGIGTGLGRPVSSVSVMVAMANAAPFSEEFVVAVPMGRNAICIQPFVDRQPTGHPQTITTDTFFASIDSEDSNYALHGSLTEKLKASSLIYDAGFDLAYSIGKYCSEREPQDSEPLFVSKNF